MPYKVTFTWKGRRYASADSFDTTSSAKTFTYTLAGLNPRIARVKDAKSCPSGFKKIRGRCVK